ncbi:MAG: DUF695 domain-containing protein [Nitrospirae bacterium]|nr:DUF695 domain-containing protein [Nitrospirota bacterium]
MGSWNVLQGDMNGKPIFIRVDTQWKESSRKTQYPYRIGIAIPLNNPNNDGLPSNDEMNILNSIEDLIDKELIQEGKTILTLIITTNSMREFVLYTNIPKVIQSKYNVLKNKVKTHEVQMIIENDPKWEVYKSFLH